jgi:endogenous inhibitor of DNA gyrase (YacG/DUF329 family)
MSKGGPDTYAVSCSRCGAETMSTDETAAWPLCLICQKLALALGRPAAEIEEWTSGSGVIDGDVIMKARGLALNRGIEIE